MKMVMMMLILMMMVMMKIEKDEDFNGHENVGKNEITGELEIFSY